MAGTVKKIYTLDELLQIEPATDEELVEAAKVPAAGTPPMQWATDTYLPTGQWKPMTPIQPLEEPTGWIGDPEEWPILFFPKMKPQYYWKSLSLETYDEKNPVADMVHVYVQLVPDDFDDVMFEIQSALPDFGDGTKRRGSWLEYEMDVAGGTDILRWALGVDDHHDSSVDFPNTACWMLAHGYCPWQVLLVRLTPHYSTYHGPDGTEYDFEIDGEVLWAEPLSPAEHCKNWRAFMDQWVHGYDDEIECDMRGYDKEMLTRWRAVLYGEGKYLPER